MRAVAMVVLGLACLGPSYANADDAGPSFGSASHFTEATGAAIYAAACASCHMPQGQGAVGAGAYPALDGNPRVASVRYVELRVLFGRAAMPPFGRTLSDDQIAAVVAYVQARFGGGHDAAPTPAEVSALR